MNDIGWAIKHLEDGKKVKRDFWLDRYLVVVGVEGYGQTIAICGNTKLLGWVAAYHDLTATDWKLA